MEEKKYEAGRVEISSAEYRDLVATAVANEKDASRLRYEKWKLEEEKKKLEEKLAVANKELEELSRRLNTATEELDFCRKVQRASLTSHFHHTGETTNG